MAGISNYLADHINDWLHGNAVGWTPPTTTYFALMTSLPTASGGGVEVSGGSYARVAFVNNSSNWPASANGTKSNGAAMTWPTPTAFWGSVVGVAEYDAATGGNLLTFASLATATSILSGQLFSLPSQAAVYNWTGSISSYLSDKLNDWLHGGGTYTVPTTTYLGLMSTTPTQSTAGTETSGGSYARIADANNATHWPASVAQTKTNANDLTWPTASTNWTGPDTGVAEYDAASGGNLLLFGSLASGVTVNSGATPQVPAGGALITVG